MKLAVAIAWAAALLFAAACGRTAWDACVDSPPPGKPGVPVNRGHAIIDFDGQWLLGRLLLDGHGPRLYSLSTIRSVVEQHYSTAPPVAWETRSEIDTLMDAFIGEDDRGGPLYPPVHAFVMAPLALLEPIPAYRTLQLAMLGCLIASAVIAGRALGGGFAGPAALGLFLLFPGAQIALDIGQNSPLSQLFLVTGWALARRRPTLAGVAWAGLAFKPVWAASFLLALLLLRRWRTAAAMAVTGAALVLLTLPVVGVQAWFDWLAVGRLASSRYLVDANWIACSRDLLGIVPRWTLDFTVPLSQRVPTPGYGYALLGLVAAGTLLVALVRPQSLRDAGGRGAAFVLLGCHLLCFHFMHYDVLLAALPVGLLLAHPKPGWYRRFAWTADGQALPVPVSVTLLLIVMLLSVQNLGPTLYWHATFQGDGLVPLTFEPGRTGTPYETFALLALWAWCGVRLAVPAGDPWQTASRL